MSNLSRKVVAVGLSLTTAVWFAGAVIPAFAQTSQTTIAQLLAQIQALQAQLIALQASSSATPSSSYNFTQNLTLGSKGADVTALQGVLISGGYLKISAPTAFFGPLTKAALAKWQAAAGVSPAVGYFGPKSRAAIALTTPTTPTTPVVVLPVGTDLQVSLAVDTPSVRTIGSGTAFNPALKVSLTAGSKAVNVTGVTLSKTGFVANTNLNGVDIVDAAGVRHGNVITSINADNTIGITFSSAPITVPAGQSTSFLVRFNLLSGNLNGNVGFSIGSASAITADTTAVSGSFPIVGSLMTIVNGGSSLASTTLDVLTGTGSSTLNVNLTSMQEITKFRLAEVSSNEGLNLYSLTLYNYGNAGAADYKDVTLIGPDGSTVLATAQPADKYVTFNLATPFFIDKGQTKDFTVKAKLVDGTTKTINLVVYNNYDIDIRGFATGVSVIPAVGTNDTAFPIGNGFNIQTIGSGSLSQNKASDSPSSSVVPGSTNVVLAKYIVKPTGENYELRAVKFWVTSSTGVTKLTGTVYVKVNGATVYSSAASGISVTTATEYTLSSYPVIAAGQDSTITIDGSINSTATASDNYQVKDFQITSAKRLTTNDLVSNPTSATDANSIAVKAAALKVTTLATPILSSIVVGTSQFEYATILLDASTGGEDVRVSKIVVKSDGANLTEVQNLYLYKDSETSSLSTTASTASNAATISFDFSSPIIVAKATTVTLHLKGDVVSGTNAHTFNVASTTSAVTAVGVSTGNSLTNGSDITFAGAGQAMTHVAAGTLVLSDADGSPNAVQVVTVGTTNKTFFAFKLTSQYEKQKITTLTVYATSTSGGLSTTTLQNVKFYEGTSGTAFATAQPVCQTVGTVASSTSCTYTVTNSDNLLSQAVPFTGTTIYVKADIGAGGIAKLGDSFRFVMTSSTADIAVKGLVTGSTSATKTGVPAATGLTYVTSQPVVVAAYSPTTATTCGSASAGSCTAQKIAVFKVTNSGTNSIRLSSSTSFKFNEGGNTTTSTYNLYTSAQDGSPSDASLLLSGGVATTSASTVTFQISTSTAADRTITGNGGYRYLTVKTMETAAAGNRFQFSVNALGQLLYQVDESQLGYKANPASAVTTLTEVAQGLYIDGKPSTETVSTGY